MRPSLPGLVISALLVARNAAPQEPLRLDPAVAQLVMVDVFVTDSKGRPIADLVASDFEMLDDHRRVEIAAFEGPRSRAEARPGPGVASGVAGANAPRARDVEVMVIFIDRRLLSAAGQNRANAQAGSLARDHLKSGGRVVVVGEDGPLRPMTPVTTSIDEVQAALGRIKGWAASAPGASEERTVLEIFENVIETQGCLPGLQQLLEAVRDYARWRGIEAQEARDRLNGLVDGLVGIPGRKAVVYVSEGLEQRPGVHLFDQITAICPEVMASDFSQVFAAMQEIDTSRVLKDASARANAARVTFYPLDARGLMPPTAMDLSRGDRRYIPSAKNDFIRDANMVNPYQQLAAETGGFPLVRGLSPEAASKRLDAEALGHYVLAFAPARDPDGKAHDITVRFRKERKLEIRHRQSYLHAQPQVLRAQRVLSALFFGLEEDALDAALDIRRGPTGVILRMGLPFSALRFQDTEAGRQARVRVVIAHRSLEGESKRPAVVREREFTIPESGGGAAAHELLVEVPIDGTSREFAVGIEDLASGAMTYLRRTLGNAERPMAPSSSAPAGPGDALTRVRSRDGTAIAVECAGSGPSLVIVHGGIGDHTRWTPMTSLLSPNFTVCAMDRRGHGVSGDAPSHELAREAEDVAAVVESRSGPVYLLGHSYGGVAALEATFLTRKVARLILYEPPLQDRIELSMVERIETLLGAGERDLAVTLFLREIVRLPAGEVEAMRSRPSWATFMAGITSQPRELRALAGYRFQAERMEEVSMPTLLLTGSDTASPYLKEAIRSLQATLPDATLVVLEGQQHNAMDSGREQLSDAIVSFLKARPPG